MEGYLTNDSAPQAENSVSQGSFQCLNEFSGDENRRRVTDRFPYSVLDLHKTNDIDGDEANGLHSGSSALRNRLPPPLEAVQSHPGGGGACLSSNSITSSSPSTLFSCDPSTPSSFSLSSGLVSPDHHRLIQSSMQYGDFYSARQQRASTSLNPLRGSIECRAIDGGRGSAVVGAFGMLSSDRDLLHGSDLHLMKPAPVGRSYRCRMCDQEFENKSDMQRHAKDVHRLDEKGHRCSKCLKSFPSSQQLAQHSLVHSNIRRYPCRFCNKAFKQLSHVQQHQRIHTGERPYRCTVDSCTKAFRQLSSLQQHIKGHNVPLPKSYVISPKCTSLATRPYRATDKIHSGVARPHDLTCQVCEKQCVDEVRFFEHIHRFHPDYWRVFSSGRPLSDFIDFCHRDTTTLFTCSICHVTFDQETVYWKHMMTHSSSRGRSLEEVEKDGENGEMEMEVEDGLRMYDCTICCKLFTKESYLLRHLEMKLDAEHSAQLEEFRKSGAFFHLADATTGRKPQQVAAPLLEQIGDGSDSRDGRGGCGVGGSGEVGHERKPSPAHLMPPMAHRSSFSPLPYPGIYPGFNASRSIQHHQTNGYNRFSSVEHHRGNGLLDDPDQQVVVVKQEVMGCLSAEEGADHGVGNCQTSDHLRVSRSVLPRSSSSPDGSPGSLKSYNERDIQSDGSRGFYRSFYSSPAAYLDDRSTNTPASAASGLGLLNSSRTLFQNQLLALTATPSGFGLTRPPDLQEMALEEQMSTSPINYHQRAEQSPSFVPRYQPLRDGGGGSPPVFALTSPRLFAHSSAVSPSYGDRGGSGGGLSQAEETFRRPATHCFTDAFQRRNETLNDVMRSASRERALQCYEEKQQQNQQQATSDNAAAAKGVHHHQVLQRRGGFPYFDRDYLHQQTRCFEPTLKSDIHNFLRRTNHHMATEADIGMFLRRSTDISDHFMASTVNHLTRSVTGLR